MALGKQKHWAVGLALALASIATHTMAQPPQSQVPSAPSPQQDTAQMPDAPTPLTLPTLNTIIPAAPALPSAPVPQAANLQAPAAGTSPGSALPSAPAQTPESADDGPPPDSHPPVASIVVPINFVEVPFTVKDSKNRLVPGLTYRDVRLYENGVRQQLRLFTVDPFPLSVALVIDQSVTFDTMEKINASLSSLQGAFTPYDEIAVFTYNNGVTKQTDFTAAQSARLGVILDRSKGKGRDPIMGTTGPMSHGSVINNTGIDGVPDPGHQAGSSFITPPREYHTLNDAIYAAAQATSSAGRGRRRVVYVISDGKEYGSKVSQKEVIKYLQTNKVAVYATLVGDASIPGMGFLDRVHLPLTMRDDVLPKYAAATGGQVDPEFRPKGIENSFARITEEVRTQYTAGYYTHESPLNESFRKIEVRVMRSGLNVIAKEGYYPSAADSRPNRPAPVTPSATP